MDSNLATLQTRDQQVAWMLGEEQCVQRCLWCDLLEQAGNARGKL